jgi:iron complex outermembrane receptor protein
MGVTLTVSTSVNGAAMRRLRLLAGCALGGVLLLQVSPAFAAAAQPASEGVDAESDDGVIVVTAQKRAEAVEQVPISIAAVSQEQLKAANIEEVLDLPQAVPSLRINYAGTFVLPTIRGVGSIVALPGLTQNIATYVDGYYVPTPSASNFALANVESVSVLKGPQGTLFGANATGGAIQITTLKPQYKTSAIVRLGYSSYDDIGAEAYVTTGLTDNIAVDVAASYGYGERYVTNIVDGNKNAGQYDRWSIRSKLLFEPTDALSFTLAYEHTYTDDPISQLVVPRDGITIGRQVPGTIITFDSPKRVALTNPGFARRETDSYTLTSAFDFGFATLTSYTGYREDFIAQGLDYDATSAALNFSNWTVDDSTLTQEINLASNGSGRLSWVLGGFYMKYKDAYDFNVNGGDVFTSRNKTQSYAAFADATYEVVDKLFLTGGIRYTEDKPCVAFNLQAAGVTDQGCVKFNNVSVRGVARYEVGPRSNVYASYTQGYRSGGLPASSFSTIPVQPEKIDAYEIGFKTAGSALRMNIAAFYYDYRDIQVTSYGAGGQSLTVNAAKAEIYGIDGDLTYKVTDDFNVTLAGSWTHAKYKDFPNALGRNIDFNNTAIPYLGTFNVDATGFRVERTPRFSGSIAANYGFDLADGRLELNGNLFYTGSYFFDPAHQLRQPSYSLLNLKATWTDPSDHFDFSIFGKNVLNEKYFVSNFVDPSAARARYGEPATFGGSITYRY